MGTELGTENIMKILLVIALFGAVQAKPWFYGHYPVVYHPPTVYASNVCRNAAGAVVACAEGTAGGIYKFADAPATFGLHGLAVAPAAAEERKVRLTPKLRLKLIPGYCILAIMDILDIMVMD